MNILVTSAGRRVKVIEYFKKALEKDGKVVATDCDAHAPALYFAHEFELVPRIDDTNYISILIEICKKHNIDGVVSLIDPELELLAENKSKFDEEEIKLVLSPLEMIQNSFDKQETYHFLSEISVPGVPTFNNYEEVLFLLDKKELTFPLVVKPAKGSASLGIYIVSNKKELENVFFKSDGFIIQPFYKDKEFGIDVYIDMVSGELVDIFIKEKIKMRSGETDKSISVHNDEMEKLVIDFISKTNFSGPIDIDCFEFKGDYYISEINPRFGGGYPHAYEMGCDFMNYIVNNLNGNRNLPYRGLKYNPNYVMMKYDNVEIIKNPL